MRKQKIFKLLPVVAALIFALTSNALAELNTSVVATGNNVGLNIHMEWGGGLRGTQQFPQGSGHTFGYSSLKWSHSLHVVRDIDENGTIEDTTVTQGMGGWPNGTNASLESYEQLKAIWQTGELMEYGAKRPEVAQVWSSKDPADVADWPVQFREGRTAGGAPIIHGAETVCILRGDPFNEDFDRYIGASYETAYYFMDFGESNNMVYGHTFIRNMTEYLKWNADIASWSAVKTSPDGHTWHEMLLSYNCAGMRFPYQGANVGFAFHPKKKIQVHLDQDGVAGSWNTFFIAHQILRCPSHKGVTMDFTNCAVGMGVNYGFDNQINLLESGRPDGKVWQLGKGDAGDLYNYQINPWTGQVAKGFPGDLRGTEWENDWVFGTFGHYNYNFYGVLEDFAPRDSTSFDFVFMFVEPASPPAALPPNEIAYMADPGFRAQLAPVERYADIAQVVYDGGYILPSTPSIPTISIIPGDRQVTITWSDVNLTEPDPFGQFLEAHPELDPDGVYRKYDFEGYRLYRSFVGPSDSHSELIWQSSLSANNLQFHYIDKLDNDEPYFRMRNGMKVWYALVPYDRNVDPASRETFSLPDPASGKQWFGSPQKGLYTILPRSDASNFRAADLVSITFEPSSGTASSASFATIPGDGNGMLTGIPALIAPKAEITLTPIIMEKITSALTVHLSCTGMSMNGPRAGRRYVVLTDASGSTIDDPGTFIMVRSGGSHGLNKLSFSGGQSNDGTTYAVLVNTDESRTGSLQSQIDAGAYSGAAIHPMTGTWGFGEQSGTYFFSDETWQGMIRSGQYKITWKASGSDLTLIVQDATRGKALAFSPYIDDPDGWGIVPPGVNPYNYLTDAMKSGMWNGSQRQAKPQSERSVLLIDKIAASNTDDFMIYVDGQFFNFTGITAMPSDGAVMTVTSAFGSWNGDNTEFTQQPDPFYPGDKWTLTIKPSSLNNEDIDLSKIRAVPNPYIATSFLDIGPASRRMEFVNLPDRCTIRIYTLTGNLVNVLNHIGSNRNGWGDFTDWDELDINSQPKEYTGYDNHSGTEPWNLKNRFGQLVASGLYFYHVTDARGMNHTGSFYVIN